MLIVEYNQRAKSVAQSASVTVRVFSQSALGPRAAWCACWTTRAASAGAAASRRAPPPCAWRRAPSPRCSWPSAASTSTRTASTWRAACASWPRPRRAPTTRWTCPTRPTSRTATRPTCPTPPPTRPSPPLPDLVQTRTV